MADVFVSFVKEDWPTAQRLIASLNERGWTVSWPPNGDPSPAWDAATAQEFDAASLVVVLWSKAALNKEWLRAQARRTALRRRLVSALIEDVRPPFVFPMVQPIALTDGEGRLSYPGLLQVCNVLSRTSEEPERAAALHHQFTGSALADFDHVDIYAQLRPYDTGGQLRQLFENIHIRNGSLSPNDVRSAKVQLAEEMLENNHSAPEVQGTLTAINNEIYRHIATNISEHMAETGWGELPVPLTLFVMGSGGRRENYLFSDQDNGFILGDYADNDHLRIDTYFREFAERMCRRLDGAGLPYCPGYCMAVNPLWRKTLPQWGQQISLWVAKSNFVALRFADIFFDFQPIWGDGAMGQELRHMVSTVTRENPLMLQQMLRQITVSKVALDFFGNIAPKKSDDLELGKVNVKHSGIIPLVETVRLLALRDDITETSTLGRISALHDRRKLSDDEGDDLTAAYHVISDIILRKEIKAYHAGQKANYDLFPETVTERDRLQLLGALRAIRRLRRRLRHELLQEEV